MVNCYTMETRRDSLTVWFYSHLTGKNSKMPMFTTFSKNPLLQVPGPASIKASEITTGSKATECRGFGSKHLHDAT